MTFTDANWDTPQTITITGVNDDISRTGDSTIITATINDPASANEYDFLADQTHETTFTDDDTAGYTLSSTGGTTTENG